MVEAQNLLIALTSGPSQREQAVPQLLVDLNDARDKLGRWFEQYHCESVSTVTEAGVALAATKYKAGRMAVASSLLQSLLSAAAGTKIRVQMAAGVPAEARSLAASSLAWLKPVQNTSAALHQRHMWAVLSHMFMQVAGGSSALPSMLQEAKLLLNVVIDCMEATIVGDKMSKASVEVALKPLNDFIAMNENHLRDVLYLHGSIIMQMFGLKMDNNDPLLLEENNVAVGVTSAEGGLLHVALPMLKDAVRRLEATFEFRINRQMGPSPPAAKGMAQIPQSSDVVTRIRKRDVIGKALDGKSENQDFLDKLVEAAAVGFALSFVNVPGSLHKALLKKVKISDRTAAMREKLLEDPDGSTLLELWTNHLSDPDNYTAKFTLETSPVDAFLLLHALPGEEQVQMTAPSAVRGLEQPDWGTLYAGVWSLDCVQAFVAGFTCAYDSQAKLKKLSFAAKFAMHSNREASEEEKLEGADEVADVLLAGILYQDDAPSFRLIGMQRATDAIRIRTSALMATAPGLILSSGMVPVDDATDYSSPQRVMEALVQTDWHKSVKVMLNANPNPKP